MFILVRCVASSNISLYYFQVCLEDESDFPSSFESPLEHFGAISIKLLLNIHKGSLQKKNCKIYDILQMGGQVANSKHDFFPKKNYDKRVGGRIISQIIKTINNSLFIEKQYSKPTVITFTIIFLHMSSENYCFVYLYLMNSNFIEFKVPVYLLFH